ncbi:MAG: pre-peptidase C-terminal domain-containing protein [Chloroflexota bacterium]
MCCWKLPLLPDQLLAAAQSTVAASPSVMHHQRRHHSWSAHSYTLELATGDQVNIYLSGTTAAGEELDTMLYVYDSEGTELGNNDDLDADTLGSGFEGVEAPFDLTLILEVATFGDLGQGTYTLRVERP